MPNFFSINPPAKATTPKLKNNGHKFKTTSPRKPSVVVPMSVTTCNAWLFIFYSSIK